MNIDEMIRVEDAAYCPHGFLTGCPTCSATDLPETKQVSNETIDKVVDKLNILKAKVIWEGVYNTHTDAELKEIAEIDELIGGLQE